MKLPRDVSGQDIAHRLAKLGYEITRQTGSHIRLTTHRGGEHHLTVPAHANLRVGTLSAILTEVAEHLSISRAEVVDTLFG